jgi:ABC-type transporter Mla subunit MlaD
MMRNSKRIFALLLSVLLLLPLCAPAAAAAGTQTVIINSTASFRNFAKNCSLDVWSHGKTATLTCDLDFSEEDFTPVPTFGGVFDGGGHTISGIRLTASGSNQGLFRYVQSGGVVKNLAVSGIFQPAGTGSEAGGVCGSNAGTLQNCSFSGTVEGDGNVGGVCGINQETGVIAACSTGGTVSGESAVGGVCGRNLGTLLQCNSRCLVNSTSGETLLSAEDLETLDVDSALTSLTSDRDGESADAALTGRMDIGGIVGYSSGIVQSCINTGTVGYPHVGYNVGGVAGRQTGYLSGCSNTGEVYGRKDVGGIAGQSEPYIVMRADGSTIGQLRHELDKLNTLVDQALDDADAATGTISTRLTAIGACTDAARDSSKELMDTVGDMTDDNVGTLNSLSVSVTNTLDQISPAMDDLADAADSFAALSDQLEDALKVLTDAADTTETMLSQLGAAVDDLQKANAAIKRAVAQTDSALTHLKDAVVIDDEAAVRTALGDLADGISALGSATGAAGSAVQALRAAMGGGSWTGLPDNAEAVAALDDLAGALLDMSTALTSIGGALSTIQSSTHITWDEVSRALEDLSSAASSLQTASDDMNTALAHLKDALATGETLSGQLGKAAAALKKVAVSAAAAGRSLHDALTQIKSAVDQLRKDGPVKFTTLGEDYRSSSAELYASLCSLSEEMGTLNSETTSAGHTLNADLRAVSDQFHVVFDLLLDAVSDLEDGTLSAGDALSERIQDTSDEDISATKRGKIADSRNTGTVEGDRNVGGIVGSMAIEYDLDPEDDSTAQLSYGATYETKSVLQNCLNRGTVTGKKDCIGGLAGRMDLGTVIDGQNYGTLSSTGGGYVGGIAGLSEGSIRRSYAKCTLSGGNYIGGIAGQAAVLRDCAAIVTITGGEEYVGAVAGQGDTGSGEITGNYYVDTGWAGVDGISYAGCAEGASFDFLRGRDGIPTEFVSFSLTLKADGSTVKTFPFFFGDDLTLIDLPAVPEKDGYYGQWPEFDASGRNSDITLEAVYTPWITLIASGRTSGSLPVVLADGQFTEDAVLLVQDSAVEPPAAADSQDGACIWDITLSGTALADDDTVPLRLLNEGGGKAAVWQYQDGQWTAVEAEQNGQYLLTSMTGVSGTFCVCPQKNRTAVLCGMAGAALLVILVLLRYRRKQSGTHSKTSTAPKAAEEHAEAV